MLSWAAGGRRLVRPIFIYTSNRSNHANSLVCKSLKSGIFGVSLSHNPSLFPFSRKGKPVDEETKAASGVELRSGGWEGKENWGWGGNERRVRKWTVQRLAKDFVGLIWPNSVGGSLALTFFFYKKRRTSHPQNACRFYRKILRKRTLRRSNIEQVFL